MVYCNSASLMHSLLMCCLQASMRCVAACLLMMDSCSYRSLSISCWTLISSFSSTSASSSFASSQSWTSIWLSSALSWLTCDGGGGLVLRCWSPSLVWLDPGAVVYIVAGWCSWNSGMSPKVGCSDHSAMVDKV
jgi:hypothetical protein